MMDGKPDLQKNEWWAVSFGEQNTVHLIGYHTHEAAAEAAAEYFDDDDAGIAGEQAIVLHRWTGEITDWVVESEAVIHYDARLA